ncbi:unnamed protein product [Rhizophagus irregularis]|nr:unnamed protein product [Rhizophagus irregularis]
MSVVTVFVQSENASSERRFDVSLTIKQLKVKLEPITGIPADSQVLQLYNGDTMITSIEGDNYMIGDFPVNNFMTLKVNDANPNIIKTNLQIYHLWKNMNYPTMNMLNDQTRCLHLSNTFEEEAKNIKVGDRCEVDFGEGNEEGLKRRGIVKFVGETKFKPGYWVGVQYDEPVGKHDGTVQGEKYFESPPKHGAFVRPNKVKVGDYPEETFEEEM